MKFLITIILVILLSGCGEDSESSKKVLSIEQRIEQVKNDTSDKKWNSLVDEVLEQGNEEEYDLVTTAMYEEAILDPRAVMGLAMFGIKSKEEYATWMKNIRLEEIENKKIRKKQLESAKQIGIGDTCVIDEIEYTPTMSAISRLTESSYRIDKKLTEKEYLVVYLDVKNISKTKAVSAMSIWRDTKLTDEHGNTMDPNSGIATSFEDHETYFDLSPNDQKTIFVVFDRPVESANQFKIECDPDFTYKEFHHLLAAFRSAPLLAKPVPSP